jgi:hypothetical protein
MLDHLPTKSVAFSERIAQAPKPDCNPLGGTPVFGSPQATEGTR